MLVAAKSARLLWWYLSNKSNFQEIFEGEMLTKIKPTNLHQIFCKVLINLRVILKSIKGTHNTGHKDLQAQMGKVIIFTYTIGNRGQEFRDFWPIHACSTIKMSWADQSIFQKEFERELLMQTQPSPPPTKKKTNFKILSKFQINSKVIFKNMIIPDKNIQGDFKAWKG